MNYQSSTIGICQKKDKIRMPVLMMVIFSYLFVIETNAQIDSLTLKEKASVGQKDDKDIINNPKVHEYFDFWVGTWNVKWKESDGGWGHGTNIIKPILNGSVLQENFKVEDGKGKGYQGTSLSILSKNLDMWKQAWVDNRGAFYNFTGMLDGNKRFFITDTIESNGRINVNRMVFYSIKDNSFTWDWEKSIDGGKNWELQWRIFYSRIDD